MKLSRIDIIGLNGGDGLHYHELDILDRLESATKINGAHPKDIADAIETIKVLRGFKADILFHLNPDKDGGFFLTPESWQQLYEVYGKTSEKIFQRVKE